MITNLTITNLTKEDLIAFEEDISDCFQNKMIRAPIHLDHNNEEQMLEIFKDIKADDFVVGTWRMHYACLLKGVPPAQLKKDILAGKSITLCYKDYNIFSSAIVAGSLPIALGIAFDLKRKQSNQKVYCFVGDMGSMTGAFHEALSYASNFQLPIIFVIADNNKSVCTDTNKTWGQKDNPMMPWDFDDYVYGKLHKWTNVWYYQYESKFPHAGTGGGRIQF